MGDALEVGKRGFYGQLPKNPDQATQLEQPMQQMAHYLGQVVAKEQQMKQATQQAAQEEAVPVEGGYE